MPEEEEKSSKPSTPLRRVLRLLRRALYTLLSCILLYGLWCAAGLIPVNTDFENASDGIEIFVGDLCSGDPAAHFGLGPATKVERVEVHWPDGTRTVRTDVPVNQRVVIEQPPRERP